MPPRHEGMTSVLRKFVRSLGEDGLLKTLSKTANWLYINALGRKDRILERRVLLSKNLYSLFDGVVKYGPLSGFKLSRDQWWGKADRGSMLLGLYEQELLDSIVTLKGKYRYLIDLGAADGYYGVGLVARNIFEKSWCYEISEVGQKSIVQNSLLNGVSDRVVVRGEANERLLHDFLPGDAASSVLIIDIEGGEFDLLTSTFLEKFLKSVIFIELHDWFFADGQERLDKLQTKVQPFFIITPMTTGSRNLSVFPELRMMNDTDRWLICSEGRSRLPTWWRMDPI